MRYLITPTGVQLVKEEKLPTFFKYMSFSQMEANSVDIECFNYMVDSPVFLFKHQNVSDESLYQHHNKRLPTTLYLNKVGAEEQEDYRIVVRSLYYGQTEGFLVSVFCVPTTYIDALFRKFYIDEYLNDNP